MSYKHPQYLNLKLPVIRHKSFDPNDFPDWGHKAQHFFSQYGLWDIVIGKRKNPAGEVEPSVGAQGEREGALQLRQYSIVYFDNNLAEEIKIIIGVFHQW